MAGRKRGKGGAPRAVLLQGLDRHIRARTRVFAAAVAALCFGGLLVRLFVLQVVDPGGYAERAADQQLRDTVIPAPRGEIYAADGTLLAASETCWTIRAAPRELEDALVAPAAAALSEILELDEAEVLENSASAARTTAFCAAAWTARRRTPCAAGAGKTGPRASRSARTPAASIPKAISWAACSALPMWTTPGSGGWNLNTTRP